MDEITVIFTINATEMSPIIIKKSEFDPIDKRLYSYAGDIFQGLLDISVEKSSYIIELDSMFSLIQHNITEKTFYNFTAFYNKWLSRRRKYKLEFGEFFDMNLEHLSDLRDMLKNISNSEYLSYMILSDWIGQDLLLHMLGKLYAEKLRGLSREEIALSLGLTPTLTPDEIKQVNTSLFNATVIPQHLLDQ